MCTFGTQEEPALLVVLARFLGGSDKTKTC